MCRFKYAARQTWRCDYVVNPWVVWVLKRVYVNMHAAIDAKSLPQTTPFAIRTLLTALGWEAYKKQKQNTCLCNRRRAPRSSPN